MSSLPRELPYAGTTPFGTCFQQALANVLAAQGLAGAADLLGVSFGFGYRPELGRLGGGQRWLAGVARLSGLELARHRYPSLAAALSAERAALRSGAWVVAGVDSFHIESPYRGRQHIAHALIVVAHGSDHVVVRDPMNAADPVSLPLATYGLARGGPEPAGFDTILARGTVDGPYPAAAAVAALRADLAAHGHGDTDALDAFIASVAAGEAQLDVADAAAERRYAHRTLALAVRENPALAGIADGLENLARRWYLVHTLSLEADGVPVRRALAFLADLRDRESRVREELAGPRPDPRLAVIRRIVGEQTAVDTANCRDTDDLWAAGMTSLESVRVMVCVEEELRVEFPPELLTRRTFGSLAALHAAVSQARAVHVAPAGG